MTRPNSFQVFLDKKTPDQKTELKNLVLQAQTSKLAFQQIRKRGFRGSYDSILNYRNANKEGRAEMVAANVALLEQKLVETTQSAGSPLEAALQLSTELNALSLKLIGLLAGYDWSQGGESLTVRDALKLAAIVPSLSRASIGSLTELFNLRKELHYEYAAESLFEELLIEARLILEETPEYLPIVEKIVDCTKTRLEMTPERCLATLVTSDKQTESL